MLTRKLRILPPLQGRTNDGDSPPLLRPHRAKLAERIKELFQEDTSFSQGDLVRLIFDADKGELCFLKCSQPVPPDWEDAEWAPVGKPLGGLKGKQLAFACTVYHDKDKVEYRIGDKPPPALPRGPDLFAAKPTAPGGVYPSLSDWRFAQGKGSGEFARDDFTVIRHEAFGTTIELLHTADGSFQVMRVLQSSPRAVLTHPQISPTSEWDGARTFQHF